MAHHKDSFYFQKDAFVEKFRPLTYYEIVTGKPLRKPIPNSRFVFHSNMQSVTTVVRFNEILHSVINPIMDKMGDFAKATAVQGVDFSQESTKLIQGMITITRILWEFTKKPKWFLSRRKMWKSFFRACMDDSDYLFDLLGNFRDYNQRFFFTMKFQRDYKLIQDAKWKRMDFNPSSPISETAEMRIRRRGLSFSPSEKLRKQAQSSHMN